LACASFGASRGAQYHIRVGPVLWIEERIAPDRDPRIGFGNLTELLPNIAFASIGADRLREHANADLELSATSSSIACMIEGTPAITIIGAGRLHPFVQDGERRSWRLA
jgi:hypothetical protein